MEKYTINAQYTTKHRPSQKENQGENLHESQGDCLNRVPSDQMVLGTVGQGGWNVMRRWLKDIQKLS
jgi:hypothetical protein